MCRGKRCKGRMVKESQYIRVREPGRPIDCTLPHRYRLNNHNQSNGDVPQESFLGVHHSSR
ncbi:hypothetical protein BDB00DRAFT_795363 [Zychaea mexicana]|uniref:uncharacterized protein n=1 Tax=Zychaea mexicana TaxID=64656 RepID=UPI0022FEAF82|nr:uncharacterized protein BDB00DRAFT_795363 [Zychaea mexicana]KAI9499737.1 hypothetical protein BDB00DRAFT_795363 [Zychaea mexicana]